MPTYQNLHQIFLTSMKYALVTLLLLILSPHIQGQRAPDTTNVQPIPVDTTMGPAARWYAKETIYLVGGNMYMKDNKPLMGKKKLLNEFSISPSGMKLYVRSRRIRNFTVALSIAGSVGSILSSTSKNRNNLRGLMWTSIGVGIVSSWGVAYANRVRDQALWIRNYDAMRKMDEDK